MKIKKILFQKIAEPVAERELIKIRSIFFSFFSIVLFKFKCTATRTHMCEKKFDVEIELSFGLFGLQKCST